MAATLNARRAKELAFECGFELAGITAAEPIADFLRFERWRAQGFAGEMTYMTDRRGDLRSDPRTLLASARSILCVGKMYGEGEPTIDETDKARIARYARSEDYHDSMRERLYVLVERLGAESSEPLSTRVCVDTAPLLERSYARMAGLGWIGKNSCLINQDKGSWFFLGEVLLSIELEPDKPVPFRCGTCTRCIDACPTDALVPNREGGWILDSRLCISYLTIEKRGDVSPELSPKLGNHVFGCDICQDVCPWNNRAMKVSNQEPPWSLEQLAQMTEEEFRRAFRQSAVWRAKYSGFLRNVAFALGNSKRLELAPALRKLCTHSDTAVATAAQQSLRVLVGDDA